MTNRLDGVERILVFANPLLYGCPTAIPLLIK